MSEQDDYFDNYAKLLDNKKNLEKSVKYLNNPIISYLIEKNQINEHFKKPECYCKVCGMILLVSTISYLLITLAVIIPLSILYNKYAVWIIMGPLILFTCNLFCSGATYLIFMAYIEDYCQYYKCKRDALNNELGNIKKKIQGFESNI
jgi:hypothetical protein